MRKMFIIVIFILTFICGCGDINTNDEEISNESPNTTTKRTTSVVTSSEITTTSVSTTTNLTTTSTSVITTKSTESSTRTTTSTTSKKIMSTTSRKTTKAKKPAENKKTIYITPTGKRYHYDSHCNGGKYIESTLEEALSRKLTPCKKCVLK